MAEPAVEGLGWGPRGLYQNYSDISISTKVRAGPRNWGGWVDGGDSSYEKRGLGQTMSGTEHPPTRPCSGSQPCFIDFSGFSNSEDPRNEAKLIPTTSAQTRAVFAAAVLS